MMIFLDKKLVVFATPKTGSTALHHAIGKFSDLYFKNTPAAKHLSPNRYKNTIKGFVDDLAHGQCETLAVIREPIEWLGSWYRYRSRDDLAGHENSTRNVSFDQFVEAYLSPERPAFASVGSQARFFGNGKKDLVTYPWRYDCLHNLQLFLSLRLDKKFELEPQNVSPSMNLELSPENKKALLTYFTPDYEIYETAIGSS